jgi:hypothetical protein
MHMNTLDMPMLIRRAGYELEITVDHQLKFLKAFGPALLKAHSDVEGLAESIEIPKLAPPAPQAIKPTPKPVTVPSSVGKSVESPAKAKCACGFHFLAEESKADYQEHIDRCEDFERQPADKKTSLLRSLSITVNEPKKQTQPRAESITCRNCKRDFSNAQSKWFYEVHIKVCCTVRDVFVRG